VHVGVAPSQQRRCRLFGATVVLGHDVEQQALGALQLLRPLGQLLRPFSRLLRPLSQLLRLLGQLLGRRHDQPVGEELQAVGGGQQPVVQSERETETQTERERETARERQRQTDKRESKADRQ